MAIISTKMLEVDIERRKVLVERALEINEVINKIIQKQHSFRYGSIFLNDYNARVEKSASLYKRTHNEILSYGESTILALYTIFPDDISFTKLCNKFENNFEALAKAYGITKMCALLRYRNMIDLKEYNESKNNTNILRKKNNQ